MQIPQMKTKQREEVCQVKRKTEKDEKNENPENSLSQSNDKKEPEGSDSAQGQMNRLMEARTVRTGFIL